MKFILFVILFIGACFSKVSKPVELTVPVSQTDTIHTIQLNFVFLQRDDGTGNFRSDDSMHQKFLDDAIDVLNSTYGNLWEDGSIEGCTSPNFRSHSGLRFVVNRLYHRDSFLWNNQNDKNVYGCPYRNNWYLKALADSLDTDSTVPPGILVFFTESKPAFDTIVENQGKCKNCYSTVDCSMGPSKDITQGSWIHFRNSFVKYTDMKNNVPGIWKVDWQPTVYQWAYEGLGSVLAHELGHSFTLYHARPICNIMNYTGKAQRHFLSKSQIDRIKNAIKTTNLQRFVVNSSVE